MPSHDFDIAEWMNVTPEDSEYPDMPFHFVGGWESTPETDTSERSVRVWQGSKTEDGIHDLNSTPENNIPEGGATYFVETRLLDEAQNQQYVETIDEAHEIGREQKEFVENAPHPTFGDRHREAVVDALDYDDVYLNTPPSGDESDIIRVDDTTIRKGDTGDYIIEREVAVEISGTLDLDEVLDSQGRLLYVDHDTGIEVSLQGQRDNRCLVTVEETHTD